MGRTSVFGASHLTSGSAVNSQKPGAYDPLQTVVGRQGNQEQGTKFYVIFFNPPRNEARLLVETRSREN